MYVKPRHPECRDCKFFSETRITRRCLNCGAGEFFEQKFKDRELNDDELMAIYSGMNDDDDN
jgi:hypothetical protein